MSKAERKKQAKKEHAAAKSELRRLLLQWASTGAETEALRLSIEQAERRVALARERWDRTKDTNR